MRFIKNYNFRERKKDMKFNVPIVAAIHSLPSFGRSALSVIVPVLSSMGTQVCPIPTSVLSSHTGGLGDVVKIDLENYIVDSFAKYKELGIDFDCIFSGYFGKKEQIDNLIEVYKQNPNCFKVVDPVMGDHGKTYRFFTDELICAVKNLATKADLITPNLTESYILINEPFNPVGLDCAGAKKMLIKLSSLGPEKVIVTGVPMSDNHLYNIGYDRSNNTFFKVKCSYFPVSYPGTGDIFSSVVVGEVLKGTSLALSVETATRFCELSVKSTFSYNTDTRFGVIFEPYLSSLSGNLSNGSYELL